MRRALLVVVLLIAACGRSDTAWLGYAEGENALIAAPQPGWITGIAVNRGAQVSVGDVLFTLDATEQRQARDSAAAQLAAAHQIQTQSQSELDFATKDIARKRAMLPSRAVSERDVEQAQSTYESAAAKVAQNAAAANAAKAALATAEWNLSERVVRARTAGRVEDIYFRTGEYAPAGTPVVAVLPAVNVYVRFFVPEAELNAVKLGGEVLISCDGCPDNLRARVAFISQQAEFTPPVIYSVGNREKLVFKVEARAAGGLPIRPGLPVVVSPAGE
ncbi:MAG: HlyD family secretion protein [Alphaproteobacteria bacterium]